MKPMQDGSKVVGLFNRQRTTEQITADFAQIGIRGETVVRDLWLKKDVGKFQNSYSAYVPPHGVVLIRIRQK
jgi:alpha-galactosidase